MNDTYKNFLQKNPLAHKDFKFINTIYFSSLDMLMQWDKELIRHALGKAQLVCQCLESLLKLADKLDGKGE